MLSEHIYVRNSPTYDTEAVKTHPDISSLLYLCESCNFGIYVAFTALYVQFTPDVQFLFVAWFYSTTRILLSWSRNCLSCHWNLTELSINRDISDCILPGQPFASTLSVVLSQILLRFFYILYY